MPLSLLAYIVFFAVTVSGLAQMSPELRASIDTAAQKVLADTGVPSATVGIVMGGKIVLTAAYGDARLSPKLLAMASMAYPVGSISKQFTATAILLLVEDGKLSLDVTVGRFFPELTRANEVTIRELLSHTSGYEDYAPQDYTIPLWTKAGNPLSSISGRRSRSTSTPARSGSTAIPTSCSPR